MSKDENIKIYFVITDIIKEENEDIPVVEELPLTEENMLLNYDWADDEKTILKPKALNL